jgi:hypothetical protein
VVYFWCMVFYRFLLWLFLITTPVFAFASEVRSPGWSVMPHLSDVIADVLQEESVTMDVWRYYARRLTLPPEHHESLSSERSLVAVMRYWQERGVPYPTAVGEPLRGLPFRPKINANATATPACIHRKSRGRREARNNLHR